MLENILDSKVKAKVVAVLAGSKEPMQVSDVARTANVSKSRASECLRELAGMGVLEARPVGRSVLYGVSSSNLAQSVAKILAQDKTLLSGLEKNVVEEMKGVNPTSIALFGSVLGKWRIGSDVDFFVAHRGELDKEKIYAAASGLSEKFGFRVSILPMRDEEFRQKAKRGEEFVLNILANHKLIHGKKLERIVWPEK